MSCQDCCREALRQGAREGGNRMVPGRSAKHRPARPNSRVPGPHRRMLILPLRHPFGATVCTAGTAASPSLTEALSCHRSCRAANPDKRARHHPSSPCRTWSPFLRSFRQPARCIAARLGRPRSTVRAILARRSPSGFASTMRNDPMAAFCYLPPISRRPPVQSAAPIWVDSKENRRAGWPGRRRVALRGLSGSGPAFPSR